jgi:hypothetical protein
MKIRYTFDHLLGSAGVLARRGRRLAWHILQHSCAASQVIHLRGFVFATLMVVAPIAVQAQPSATNLNPNLIPPPLPPPLEYKSVAPGVTLHQTSPVLYFRGILGMTPPELERALANKPAEARKILLAKVAEYTNLPADIREARLRQTELRWELTTLLKLPASDRPAFIKEFALEDRLLLEDYARFQALSAPEQKAFLEKLPPDRHQALAQALAQWDSVPEPERQQRSAQFVQICEMDQPQQQKALTPFTDAERRTMETALKTFAGLPAVQRRICIQSFQKFATMDAAERDEFLKNAARWEALTPGERNLWRGLVQKFPTPPMPPGYRTPPYPPMPPGAILPPSPPGLNPPLLSTASAKP